MRQEKRNKPQRSFERKDMPRALKLSHKVERKPSYELKTARSQKCLILFDATWKDHDIGV